MYCDPCPLLSSSYPWQPPLFFPKKKIVLSDALVFWFCLETHWCLLEYFIEHGFGASLWSLISSQLKTMTFPLLKICMELKGQLRGKGDCGPQLTDCWRGQPCTSLVQAVTCAVRSGLQWFCQTLKVAFLRLSLFHLLHSFYFLFYDVPWIWRVGILEILRAIFICNLFPAPYVTMRLHLLCFFKAKRGFYC